MDLHFHNDKLFLEHKFEKNVDSFTDFTVVESSGLVWVSVRSGSG